MVTVDEFGTEIAIGHRSKNINGGLDKDVHATEKYLNYSANEFGRED
ncbi:hypothetical protein LJE72_10160 [Desulfosporosinus sp. SRJS8]|nr:hypothetical protein [Desulfosporosinus sp. SRJS8]